MSKSFTTSTRQLRKRIKKSKKRLSPEDAKFMSFFGATDVYMKYAHEIKDHLASEFGAGWSPAWKVPLAPSLPLPTMYPITLPASDTGKVEGQDLSDVSMLPDTRDRVSPPHTASAVQGKQTDQNTDVNELEELVAVLDENGHKVNEVKALPSGIIRITVDELFGSKSFKEPELVSLGG